MSHNTADYSSNVDASRSANVQSLFASLRKLISKGSHQAVPEVCDKILAVLPGDADATRCKAIALLSSGQYDAALTVIDSSSASADVSRSLAFEKAYCLYRTNKVCLFIHKHL
jgi:signal recognition particle subunit SRP72